MERVKLQRLWQSERGFTLLEVLITIIIMGIVFAIASSSWFGVAESRRVDSATNQIVSQLRLAHTSAITRLEYWKVEIDVGTGNYRAGTCVAPCTGPLASPSRSLPQSTQLSGGVSAIVFKPTGEAQITGAGNITVAADDGAPSHAIGVNTLTSRIQVDG